jgi:hypothetical protein
MNAQVDGKDKLKVNTDSILIELANLTITFLSCHRCQIFICIRNLNISVWDRSLTTRCYNAECHYAE